jgi:hypothetical protein
MWRSGKAEKEKQRSGERVEKQRKRAVCSSLLCSCIGFAEAKAKQIEEKQRSKGAKQAKQMAE